MHGDVEFVIQNAMGRKIRKMYDRSRAGGIRTVSWNGKDDEGNIVPAGRYTCKVSSGRLVMIRTLVWKGAAQAEPPAQPEKVKSLPAAVQEVPSKAVEIAPPTAVQPNNTLVKPPAPPAKDTVPSEKADTAQEDSAK
jgi:hypothetical protein